MSTNIHDQALSILIDKVVAPVFFNKLASDYGISPATKEEAVQLLHLSDSLEKKQNEELAKAASSRVDILADLNKTIGGQQNDGSSAANLQKIASSFITDQEVRDAALIYQDALAAMQQNS